MHKPTESLQLLLTAVKGFSSPLREEVGQILRPSVFPKGSILLHAGQVASSLYVIEKGIIRAYKPMANLSDMTTTWMAGEGEIACATESFYFRKPAAEILETLEECTVYSIAYQDFRYLASNHLSFANLMTDFLAAALAGCERRVELMKTVPVEARIDRYLTDRFYPCFLRKVPDHYIASYLGTTPSTFSRRLTQVNGRRT